MSEEDADGASGSRTRRLRQVPRRPAGIGHRRRSRATTLDADERAELEELRRLHRWSRVMLTASIHDLRGPLGQINAGLAQLAAGERVNDPDAAASSVRELRRQAVAHIAAASRSIAARVRDIDALSREIHSDELVHTAETDVAQIVRAAAELVDVGARTLHLQTLPATAAVDARRVTQIVDNLVRNAVAHTPEGCAIWVRTRATAQDVVIVVEDSGPGIAPADRDRLFVPFVSDRSAGPGVGLSVVAAFARLHGGHVDVADRPGGGASFTVRLPRRSTIVLP